jgi:hypothetical protein
MKFRINFKLGIKATLSKSMRSGNQLKKTKSHLRTICKRRSGSFQRSIQNQWSQATWNYCPSSNIVKCSTTKNKLPLPANKNNRNLLNKNSRQSGRLKEQIWTNISNHCRGAECWIRNSKTTSLKLSKNQLSKLTKEKSKNLIKNRTYVNLAPKTLKMKFWSPNN